MYAILNVLVFVFLTGYAFKLLVSRPSYVKLSKNEKILLNGREKFLLLTIVTGMVNTGGFSIGLNLSALRLMIWIVMILFALVFYRNTSKLNSVVVMYLLFLGWIALSLSWTVDVWFGVRVYLKYFYPFLIMLFAFEFVKSKAFVFIVMRWLTITSFVLSLFLGGVMTHVVGIWHFYLGGVFWPMSTLADYLAIMSGVSYLMWWRTKDRKYIFLIAWFLLSSIISGVRTGLLGVFVVFGVASFLRYRTLSLPYIGGIVMAALLSVTFIPQVREKMFYDPHLITNVNDLSTVTTSQINSNGRFAIWEWSLDKFYKDNKFTGSGVGTVQERFYSGYHPFGKIKIIHNDYVQILCDLGLTGIFLYILFVLLSVRNAMKNLRKKMPKYLHDASFLVLVSFAGALTTMMTDNIVNYAFAVHSYPFIFVGIMMAYRNIYKRDLKRCS